MFIHNPDLFLVPTYRISPFQTGSIRRNATISKDYEQYAIQYLNERFGENRWLLTAKGREAIALAMSNMGLLENSQVTILTPSNNSYISSCVTSTLEQFTQHNRFKNKDTAAFFVNHEFGYLYPNMKSLKFEGLPIIEDCCTTFFSQDEYNKIGNYGTYAVYSFPKFFPIQIGGLLVTNHEQFKSDYHKQTSLSILEKEYLLKVLGYELYNVKELLDKRKNIFDYATLKFQKLGFSLRFQGSHHIVPSVLLLKNNGIIKDLNKHKEHLYKHGIQNSVFYGEDAFFLPCHQNMEEIDVDYFYNVTKQFINK